MAIVTVAVLDRSVWLRVVVIMVAMPVAVAIVTVAVFDRSVWLRVVVIMVVIMVVGMPVGLGVTVAVAQNTNQQRCNHEESERIHIERQN
eukprot:525945_1